MTLTMDRVEIQAEIEAGIRAAARGRWCSRTGCRASLLGHIQIGTPSWSLGIPRARGVLGPADCGGMGSLAEGREASSEGSTVGGPRPYVESFILFCRTRRSLLSSVPQLRSFLLLIVIALYHVTPSSASRSAAFIQGPQKAQDMVSHTGQNPFPMPGA